MAIRSTHRVDAGFSLSSMTDLVFLLLIFFVIVSTMVSPFALPVDLPKNKTSSSKTQPKVALRLMDEQGGTLNGSPIGMDGIDSDEAQHRPGPDGHQDERAEGEEQGRDRAADRGISDRDPSAG